MRADLAERSALVIGGTGTVGSAVSRELARRKIPTAFTYHRNATLAEQLANELGQRAIRVDLGDPAALDAALRDLDRSARPPNTLIYSAASRTPFSAMSETTLDAWRDTMSVNAHAAFLTCQWFCSTGRAGGDIVIVGALDRAQSLPLPVHFAASQGMLSAMVMAMAHEVASRDIRVNLMALGLLDGGVSQRLDEKRRADYQQFSALRRVGTPDEVARAIVWLALENTYINGKVLAVNGGV